MAQIIEFKRKDKVDVGSNLVEEEEQFPVKDDYRFVTNGEKIWLARVNIYNQMVFVQETYGWDENGVDYVEALQFVACWVVAGSGKHLLAPGFKGISGVFEFVELAGAEKPTLN